jgi:hypothetical protein
VSPEFTSLAVQCRNFAATAKSSYSWWQAGVPQSRNAMTLPAGILPGTFVVIPMLVGVAR